MEKCKRLRNARKALGMNTKELEKLIGLGHATIERLERDETHWAFVKAKTADKLAEFFELYETGQLGNTVEESTVVAKTEAPVVDVEAKIVSDGLTQLDKKTLTLIEFTYETLNEAKTHEEFVANISLLKRILAKY